MKRLCILIVALLAVCGCDRLDMNEELALAPDQMTDVPLSENGEGFEIIFTSLDEWRAEIEYSGYASGWASINRTNGDGNDLPQKLRVSIQKNTTKEIRYAKIVITSRRKSVEVTFNQKASSGMNGDKPDSGQKPDDGKGDSPVFRLVDESAQIAAQSGTFSVVADDVDYECKVDADWITEVTVKAAVQNIYTFEVSANTSAQSRSAVISFCGNSTCIPFTVTQAGASGEDGGEDDGGDGGDDGGEDDGGEDDGGEDGGEDDGGGDGGDDDGGDGGEGDGDDDSDWANSSFYHRSLAMRFTADWCGWCPMMATALKNAQEILGSKLEALSVHASGTYYSEVSEELAASYSITAFPTGYVDGWIMIENYDIPYQTTLFVDAVAMTETTYPVVTGVSWESSLSGGTASLDLSVYVKEPGIYKVTALAVEDDIIGYQADVNLGSIDNYEHDAVVRAAFSDASGEQFTVEETNVVRNFSYSLSIPAGCAKDNMRTVVYVQRLDTAAGRYYVDNVGSSKLGTDKKLEIYNDGLGGGNEGIVPGDDINAR